MFSPLSACFPLCALLAPWSTRAAGTGPPSWRLPAPAPRSPCDVCREGGTKGCLVKHWPAQEALQAPGGGSSRSPVATSTHGSTPASPQVLFPTALPLAFRGRKVTVLNSRVSKGSPSRNLGWEKWSAPLFVGRFCQLCLVVWCHLTRGLINS